MMRVRVPADIAAVRWLVLLPSLSRRSKSSAAACGMGKRS